jgi:polyisoprenoid-binding protein YceI
MSNQPQDTVTALPTGSWEVAPQASQLKFSAKTMWGLVTVKGSFGSYDGKLEIGPGGATGTLTIDAASLDTGHNKRDEHLRSPDFFDTTAHPQISFTLVAVTPRGKDQLEVVGDLALPGGVLRLTLPVSVNVADTGRLYLKTSTAVTRAQLHMPWNRMGMMRDPVELVAELELNRA